MKVCEKHPESPLRARRCVECKREYDYRRWKNPKYRYETSARGAHKRGLAFDIPLNEFLRVISNACVYCGRRTETMGVDRVDNSKGYVKGNCMPCCKACNLMKHTCTKEEFIAHCILIAQHSGDWNGDL